MNRAASPRTTPLFALAVAASAAACGGPDGPAPASASKTPSVLEGKPSPFVPTFDGVRIDAEGLARFSEAFDPTDLAELTPNPIEHTYTPNPSILGFEGTLDQLRAKSPSLVFDQLRIDRLDLGPDASADGPIEIVARQIHVAGDVTRAPEVHCGLPIPELTLHATQQMIIEGRVDLSGRVEGDCAAMDGGVVRLEADDLRLTGEVRVAGAFEGRGGIIELRAATQLQLGPQRVLDAGEGDRPDAAGAVVVESPDVRQVFPEPGPHLVLDLSQRVEGAAVGEYLGPQLDDCARELGLDGRGESFYVEPVGAGAPVVVSAPDALRLVAVGPEGCHPVNRVDIGDGEFRWELEADAPSQLHFGIISPEGESFTYQFSVDAVRR